MSMEPYFAQLKTGKLPNLEESMKFEGLRLATFSKRPSGCRTSASTLANAGFYYNLKEHLVICFKCGLEVSDMSSMDGCKSPLTLHREQSPLCPFLADGAKENVPFTTQDCQLQRKARDFKQLLPDVSPLCITSQDKGMYRELRQDEVLNRAYQGPGGIETDTDEPTTPPQHHEPDGLSGNATAINNNTGLFTNSTVTNIPDALRLNNTFSESPAWLRPPPPLPTLNDELQGMHNFKNEQTRLDSYLFWPSSSSIRPPELAKAGFCYLGTEDRVQCAFCKGVLRNWQPTDLALDEHKKHFPSCPFLRDPKSEGNIPLASQLPGVRLRKDIQTDHELEDDKLGILTAQALYPHMATLTERLSSLVDFCSDSNRTPEEFAGAGFFFTGQTDNVKCFFCGGGLRNWEGNDDPWLEHARWFPKCGYLRIKKGDDYVDHITKQYPTPGTKKPPVRKLKRCHKVKPEVIEEFMRSDIIEEAKDMGYPMSQLQDIVMRRFAELGTEFPNIESLVDSIIESEELRSRDTDSESDPMQNPEEAWAVDSGKSEKKKTRRKRKKKRNNTSNGLTNHTAGLIDDQGASLEVEVLKLKDQRLCKVCMDNEVNIVFLKCGHLVCCSDCAPAMHHCPICREQIHGTIRIYLS